MKESGRKTAMSQKREQVLSLKLALVTGVAVALFWFVWSLFGTVPEKGTVTSMFLDKPVTIPLSRWWDIIGAPLVVYLFSLVVFYASDSCTDLNDRELGYLLGFFLGLIAAMVTTFDQLAPVSILLGMLFSVTLFFGRDVAIPAVISMTGLMMLVLSSISGFAVGLALLAALFLACIVVLVIGMFLRKGFSRLFRWISSENIT